MLNCARRYSQILLLGLIVPAAACFGAEISDGKNQSSEQFVAGKDSYRATFELGTPRRFATRYLGESRSLELRVSPARASEFDVSRYYDSRFIHRVVVEEKNSDVVLSFQLKNAPVAWIVTHQDNPWRLLVDIWRTEPVEARSLEQEWKWQDDAFGRVKKSSSSTTDSLVIGGAAEQKPSRAVEIDLPPTIESSSHRDEKPQAKKDVTSSSGLEPVGDANLIYARVEAVTTIKPDSLAAMERQAGADVGGLQEFDSVERLATALYSSGRTQQAIPLFRRLALLNARRFQDSPRLLWMAGESAFIDRKSDLSSDYLQTLVGRFPSHEQAKLAQLRLADLRRIRSSDSAPQSLSEQYADIATDERAPWAARIAASLRLVEPVISSRPESARAHQAVLQACLNGAYVTELIRQNCAYVQTKYAVSQLDVVSADNAVNRFASQYAKDPRATVLAAELSDRIKVTLEELMRKKDFPAIAEFERAIRPAALDFTLRDADLLMARVDGWLSVGDARRALTLLQVFVGVTSDESKRNEAFALAAQLHHKLQSKERAEAALKKVFESDVRKNTGLTDRSTAALRESARPPYSSTTARLILIDELKFGRYVEREVGMLTLLAETARGRGDADKIFEILLATTPRNDDEARRIEKALMGYADDLRSNGRLAKSGDTYLAVANLAQSTKKAEASYKAGIVYARAGLVEKAKTAWQISAADTTDKKFSSLASERLERIR